MFLITMDAASGNDSWSPGLLAVTAGATCRLTQAKVKTLEPLPANRIERARLTDYDEALSESSESSLSSSSSSEESESFGSSSSSESESESDDSSRSLA